MGLKEAVACAELRIDALEYFILSVSEMAQPYDSVRLPAYAQFVSFLELVRMQGCVAEKLGTEFAVVFEILHEIAEASEAYVSAQDVESALARGWSHADIAVKPFESGAGEKFSRFLFYYDGNIVS